MKRHNILVGLLAAYSLAIILLITINHTIEMQVSIVLLTAFTSISFFLYRQHHYDAIFLKDLMIYFNDRYNSMHDDLSKILSSSNEPRAIDPDTRDVASRYFNLCSEEYIFFKLGYIPKRVQIAWEAGMMEYGKSDIIINCWKNEKNKISYYGFDFDKYCASDS